MTVRPIGTFGGERARDAAGSMSAERSRAVPGRVVNATLLSFEVRAVAGLGVVGARVGGAPIGRAAVRVTFWGTPAMVVTGAIRKAVRRRLVTLGESA